MRRLLYISITISVVIVIASLTHYQVVTHNLRKELVSLEDTGQEQNLSQSDAPVPIAPKPGAAAQTPFENNAVAPDAHGLTEQQKRELRALLAEYDRNRAAFDNEDDEGGVSERKLAETRQTIAVLQEEGDTVANRQKAALTIREIWESAGLSKGELQQAMKLLSIDPEMSLNQMDEFVKHLETVGAVLEQHMRDSAAQLSLEEARLIVTYLKDDPTTTPDEFRYITRELFTPAIQVALEQEGAL